MRALCIGILLFQTSLVAAAAQTVSAILEPFNQVEIRAAVNGRIEQIAVAESEFVTRGALLVGIDARVQRARVALSEIAAQATGPIDRAEIAVAQATALRDRIARARSKGAAQQWEVIQSEQALQLAEADLRIAIEGQARSASQLALDQAILSEFLMVAPFDGIILQIFAEEGEIVDTEKTILEIGNLDRLRATAFVPLDWLDTLTPGAEIRAGIQGQSGDITGTIVSVDPRVDPASLSVRVLLAFDNASRSLLAGTAVLLDRP